MVFGLQVAIPGVRSRINTRMNGGWRGMNVDTLWQDFRHSLRLLRLNPGFTFVALLSLALGTGANTAIFQLLNAVRLRMLPVKNPQELVEVRIDSKKGRNGSFINAHAELTTAQWDELRSRQQ